MLPASPRRIPLMLAAAAAVVVGSLAIASPALAAPAAPALSFPGAGQSVANFSDITFRWSAVDGATSYRFEDSSSAATTATGEFQTADGGVQVVTTTSTVVPASGFTGTRYWHVAAVAADGSVAWSGARAVSFASQAPDAGVGTAVTVTAPPAPAATPQAPAAHAPAAASGAAPAAKAAAPTAPVTSAAAAPAASPAASSPAPAAATPSASSASSSARSSDSSTTPAATLHAVSPASARTATAAGTPVAIALAIGLGLGLLAVIALRLIAVRRRRA